MQFASGLRTGRPGIGETEKPHAGRQLLFEMSSTKLSKCPSAHWRQCTRHEDNQECEQQFKKRAKHWIEKLCERRALSTAPAQLAATHSSSFLRREP